MLLKNLLSHVKVKKIIGETNIEIDSITYDSRKITKNCIFVCLVGENFDGHNFAEIASQNGAAAIVCSKEIKNINCTNILVDDTRATLSSLAATFFENPSSKINIIAITGTKGKTTTSHMIKSILEQNGNKVGLIGTLGITINSQTILTNNTTPESLEIQKALSDMVNSGCDYAVLEASSLGIKHHRLDNLNIKIGVFTNFSKDHISKSEHASLEEYIECKSMLFRMCRIGVLNLDDKNCDRLLKDHTCKKFFYGVSEKSDFKASNIKFGTMDSSLGVNFLINSETEIHVPIPGKFSVYNALASAATCKILGCSDEVIKKGILNCKVKGRVEVINTHSNFTLLIDYAHNAISMENILTTLKDYNPNRLIVMFGAGGNRPRDRRFDMGRVAGKLADLSIITEDNSRYENIDDIINDIKSGLEEVSGNYKIIKDRKEAIKYCIQNAQPKDIIVLAGKGHESYQEKNGVKIPFDEHIIVKEILKNNDI